jgi:hypothetical protein
MMVAGKKPVKEGCSGSANMEGAGWAGREPGDNLFCIHLSYSLDRITG